MIKAEIDQEFTTHGERTRESGLVSSSPLTKTSEARLWMGSILTLSVPLVAGLLCGAKLPWMRGVVFGLMAMAIIVTGKGRYLPKWSAIIFTGLSAWGLTGLLPLSWFRTPDWRLTMQEDFGFVQQSTLSPQPWVTLEAWTLLIGGIIWVIFCVGTGFQEKHRRFLLRGLAYGITVMALLAITMKWGGEQSPLEQVYRLLKDPRYPDQFGLFPNRNNFAGLCAAGFLLAIMMALDAWQRRQFTSSVLLTLCAIPDFVAVMDSSSRGGVLLLATGTVTWLVTLLSRRQSKQYFSVAAALLLIIGSSILLFGKPVVQRFIATVQENSLTKDARVHVFHDTLMMLSEHPIFGIALGNFEHVFPHYQVYTNNYNRFIHPESDWLWLAGEMGVIGLILALLAAGILVTAAMRRGRVKASSTDRHLRHAALIVAAITAIQGLVDTPAHLLANAFTALLLLSLATHRDKVPVPKLSTRLFTTIILLIGAMMISINSWATSMSHPLWPSRSAAFKLRTQAQSQMNLNDPAAAYALLPKAIEWEPMAWDGYFIRACLRLQLGQSSEIALQDFARARFLEPNSSNLCMLEATFWLNHDPSYAVQAWREAMRREPATALNFYHAILPQLIIHPDLREAVRSLATTAALQIQFLSSTGNSSDFKLILDDLLSHNSNLDQVSAYDQFRLFRLWSQWGNREELIRLLELNPVWRKNGWLILADNLATMKDQKGAYEMALRYITPPPESDKPKRGDIETLKRAFLHNPNDIKFAFDLFEAQKSAGLNQDALFTLTQIELDPKFQRRVLYEKSLIYAADGDFVSAWQKIRTYADQ